MTQNNQMIPGAPFLARFWREKWERCGESRVSHFRRIKFAIGMVSMLVLSACSPRDFLTRRLATDLISASAEFRTPQQFILQTGVVSNKDYLSPENLVLQHHGWISVNSAPCPAGISPPPCSDIVLTPSGVETVRTLVTAEEST